MVATTALMPWVSSDGRTEPTHGLHTVKEVTWGRGGVDVTCKLKDTNSVAIGADRDQHVVCEHKLCQVNEVKLEW